MSVHFTRTCSRGRDGIAEPGLTTKGPHAEEHCEAVRLEAWMNTRLAHSREDDLARPHRHSGGPTSSHRAHERGALVEQGQDLVLGFGRHADHDAVDAGVAGA